jgi:hypothetical protein
MKHKPFLQSEHQLQTAILQLLRFNGIYCWRNNSGKVFVGEGRNKRMINVGMAGLPDILGCLKGGRLLCLEVKTGKNKLTAIQQEVIIRLQKLGAVCRVVYSLEEVEKIIRRLKGKK